MKNLNNKGYMLVEIIVASVIAFSVAYYLLNLTYKFKDKNEDVYYSTTMLADKINITKNIMNDLEGKNVEIQNNTDNSVTLKVEEYTKKIIIDKANKTITYGNFDKSNDKFYESDTSYYTKKINSFLEFGTIEINPYKNAKEKIEYVSIKIPLNNIYTDNNMDINLLIKVNNYNIEDDTSETENPSTPDDDTSETQKKFTITYNDNGGKDGPLPQTKEQGKDISLSSKTPTRHNFNFVGWSTSAESNEINYTAEGIYTKDADITLYAVWRSVLDIGGYVSYTGSNGCFGYACDGLNEGVRYGNAYSRASNGTISSLGYGSPTTTTTGYCADSNSVYKSNGWRVAYVDTDSIYLISAASPSCLCSNGRVPSSASSCSTSLSQDSYISNLNSEALKYCNPKYAYGGVCNSSSAWAIKKSDFDKINNEWGKGNTFYNCVNTSSSECGKKSELKNLIDNGGYYWFANKVTYNTNIYNWWARHDTIGNGFIGGATSTNVRGTRIVLRLASTVYKASGSGTATSPYVINNSQVTTEKNKTIKNGIYNIKSNYYGVTVNYNRNYSESGFYTRQSTSNSTAYLFTYDKEGFYHAFYASSISKMKSFTNYEIIHNKILSSSNELYFEKADNSNLNYFIRDYNTKLYLLCSRTRNGECYWSNSKSDKAIFKLSLVQ